MFDKSFYAHNREALYAKLPEGCAAVLFAGTAPRQSADAYYPFYANRNFVYLTGIEEQELIFMAVKTAAGVEETLFLRPRDEHAERWTGTRLHAEDVEERYGHFSISYVENFKAAFMRLAGSGKITTLYLDFDRQTPEEPLNAAGRFAVSAAQRYGFLKQENLHPLLCGLRTIKAPCEIEAMRKAAVITGAGILAMMKAAHDGMAEYQLKAEFDYALAQRGVITPGFPSIICSGQNNFIIHYYDYTGTLRDGDMVLNDVGACWENETNDVSRAWPVNGKFTERQKLLYNCIYNTSEYMFSIIKPGMPMASIDVLAREYCFEQLKSIGLIEDYKDIRKLMWHNGAHHVGFDTHDEVDMTRDTAPGMVFCVDIGVYCLDWGIGFRLEDNCLITENGCENLTRDIPRSIEEIENTIRELRK